MAWEIRIKTDGTKAGTKVMYIGLDEGTEEYQAKFSTIAEELRKLSIEAIIGRKE